MVIGLYVCFFSFVLHLIGTPSHLLSDFYRGKLFIPEDLQILVGIQSLNQMAMSKRMLSLFLFLSLTIHKLVALPNYIFCSYAEMAKEEKNKISHRYRALEEVKNYFATSGITFEIDESENDEKSKTPDNKSKSQFLI